jgi:hypothetical protein
MQLSRLFLALFTSIILYSCQPNQEELNKIKRDAVIAIHDEVMPKIGQLKKFEKEAEKQIEILEMSEPVDSLQIQELKAIANELNEAYEAMFVWMRQYNGDDEGKSPEEIKEYLETQEEKISEVNEQIKTALSKSGAVLNN